MHRDVVAVIGESERNGPAEALRGAGDERDAFHRQVLASEMKINLPSPRKRGPRATTRVLPWIPAFAGKAGMRNFALKAVTIIRRADRDGSAGVPCAWRFPWPRCRRA